jgi:hypothetical protein
MVTARKSGGGNPAAIEGMRKHGKVVARAQRQDGS